nr:MAG: putative capsid protein [Picobirnavirus sp.]
MSTNKKSFDKSKDIAQDRKDQKVSKGVKGKGRSNRRNSSNTKGKGNSYFRSGEPERKVSSGPSSSLNDISWYARNPELLASAAMLPFPNRPGLTLRMGSYRRAETGITPVEVTKLFQGVMRLEYDYAFGFSQDVNSPASICAKELFGIVRRAFSGSLEEDAPDLFMYCIALDQIHAYIAYLKRIYRTINAYSPNNYMFPRAVFFGQLPANDASGSGLYESFVSQKVLFWNYINTLVNMANKFCVPNNMDIYNRHRWMNENVYLDNESIMAQCYIFCPKSFFRVIENTSTGTALTAVELPETPTPESLYQYGLDMVEALSNWEDAYTINGHIQRAFEGVPFYVAELLGQDEVLQPQHVEEVLDQIHNASFVNFEQADVMQDPLTNAIIYMPQAEVQQPWRRMIDLDVMIPTPAAITIATRLTATNDERGYFHCGTEVLTDMWITVPVTDELAVKQFMYYHMNPSASLFLMPVGTTSLQATRRKEIYEHIKMYFDVAQWRKAPILYTGFMEMQGVQPYIVDDNNANLIFFPVGELTNPTVVSGEALADLHRVCVYSEFNCFGK